MPKNLLIKTSPCHIVSEVLICGFPTQTRLTLLQHFFRKPIKTTTCYPNKVEQSWLLQIFCEGKQIHNSHISTLLKRYNVLDWISIHYSQSNVFHCTMDHVVLVCRQINTPSQTKKPDLKEKSGNPSTSNGFM